MGSMATADMLYAIDEPDPVRAPSSGTAWPRWPGSSRAGDVLVQNDIAYERYGAPQPQLLSEELNPTPAGLTDRKTFGKPTTDVPLYPTLDEQNLAAPPNPKPPAPVVTYTVKNPRPIARAESNQGALVVAGDATGLANLAAHGDARHGVGDLLLRHPRQSPRPAAQPAVAGGGPGGDRHQPQTGLPLGRPHRQHRLHRDPLGEPDDVRPERQPPRALPGHRGTTPRRRRTTSVPPT